VLLITSVAVNAFFLVGGGMAFVAGVLAAYLSWHWWRKAS